MSERNPTVPFGTFYHPPVQLADVMREKNCLSSTTYAVMNGLFSLVDFNQTDRIGNHDVFTGWTCVVSYGGLGERCGLSGRRTQDALKKLESESVGLIIREKVGKCNRYRITIYDQALNYLKANPGIPMKQMSQPVGSDKHQKNVKKIQDGASRIVDDGASESLRTERPSHYGRSVPHSRVLQEEYQETPVSDYPGANEETENRGDSLIEEKQEAIDLTPVSEVEEEAEEEKASLGEETVSPRGDTRNDIVPSKQIGEVLDSLTQAKGMDASPTDDSVEAIITAFNPQSPAISNWKHAQVASVLKGHLEGVLSAASIDMPPILFFKYCLREMDNRLADGKIDTRPSSLNYFLNAATGKDIVVCALDNLKSERTAETTVQKTEAYMQGERDRSATERKIPAAAKAELDKILGRK